MAFGQPAGPPATATQLRLLRELLEAAGHVDFRDARGPMGFTQRQANGKFTRDEAQAFIDRLEQEAHEAAADQVEVVRPPVSRPSAAERAVREMPAQLLAAELQRRGWIVVEP
jgi:hypothetical protein